MFKKQLTTNAVFGTIILAALASVIIVSQNIYMWVIFVGMVLSMLIFLNADVAYWAIFINVYIIGSLTAVHFPVIGNKTLWITDLILLVLAVKLFVDVMLKRIKFFKYNINILIFLFILLGVISAILNKTSMVVLVCGLRSHFKYIPIFLASMFYFDSEKLIKKSFLFWVLVGLINVPVAVIQFLVYHDFDAVGGLFSLGSSGILTIYQLFIVGYLFIIAENGILKRWKTIVLAMILLVPVFINQTKIVFFLLPLLFLYIYRNSIIKNSVKTICVLLLVLVLFCSLMAAYTRLVPGFYFSDMLSKDWLYKYLCTDSYYCNEGSLNRLSAITFAIDNISKSPLHFLVGVGIGNASLSNIPGGMGEYYKKYFHLKIDLVYLSRILWEYGIIGPLLYASVIFLLWKYAVEVKRASKDVYVKSISEAFRLLILFLSIGTMYDRTFLFDKFACIFWLLGGFFTKLRIRQ